MWQIALAFFGGVAFGWWWVKYQRAAGITSRDVYKGIDGVPKAGGLMAVVGAALGYLALAPQVPEAVLVCTAAFIIGILGLWDDLRGVSEYVRVFVPLLVALVVARALGEVRLTLPLVGLFYGATGWFAVLAIPVVTNAFNMLDPVNGFLPMANVAVALALAAVAYVRGDLGAVMLLLVHAAAAAALYVYNRYPARTFNGNVGSYFLGASISTIAVVYDLVAYLVLAALPFIANGVLIIFSSGGIKGREKIQRPTRVEGGVVQQDCSSPIVSLVRLAVSERAMSEYEIFKALTLAVLTTSLLTAALAFILRAYSLPV